MPQETSERVPHVGARPPLVLGIDPGTRAMGYAALVLGEDGPRLYRCGVIRPPARADIATRLAHIAIELEELLREVVPFAVAIERAFAARNVHSALRLGEARGVALALAGRAGAEVAEYSPAQAKKSVLGHGGGSKEQVARSVCAQLGLPQLDLPLDASDAISLAWAHVRELEARALRERARPSGLAGRQALPSNGPGGTENT